MNGIWKLNKINILLLGIACKTPSHSSIFIMNFTAQTVPYQQTGYFSRIITEYLNGNEFLKHFYKHPVSFEGIEASMRDRENFRQTAACL